MGKLKTEGAKIDCMSRAARIFDKINFMIKVVQANISLRENNENE